MFAYLRWGGCWVAKGAVYAIQIASKIIIFHGWNARRSISRFGRPPSAAVAIILSVKKGENVGKGEALEAKKGEGRSAESDGQGGGFGVSSFDCFALMQFLKSSR